MKTMQTEAPPRVAIAMQFLELSGNRCLCGDHEPPPLSRREEAVRDAALSALLLFLLGEQDFAPVAEGRDEPESRS